MNTNSKLRWTAAALQEADQHRLTMDEQHAAENRAAATIQGQPVVLSQDVLAVVMRRQAQAVAA
jgi:hypothetical protein